MVMLSGGRKAVMPRDTVALHGDKVQPGAQVAIGSEPNWVLPVVQAVVETSPQLELDTATQVSSYQRQKEAAELLDLRLKGLGELAGKVVEQSVAVAASWGRFKEVAF